MKYYRQCKLQRGNECTVTWVAEKFCRVGKQLKMDCGGVWVEGWFVVEVYDQRFDESYIKEHERDYTRQRAASDI